MPETPRLTKPSTSETCESRSSSRSGPRQMIVDAELLAGAFGAGADALPEVVRRPLRDDGDGEVRTAGRGPRIVAACVAAARRHADRRSSQKRESQELFHSQLPECLRRSTEHRCLFVVRVFAERVTHQPDDVAIRAGDQADRPVRPDHQRDRARTPRAPRPGTDAAARPSSSRQSASVTRPDSLQRDVGQRRERVEMAPPFGVLAVPDVRLAQMIEHEALAGKRAREARPLPATAARRPGCRRSGRARSSRAMPREKRRALEKPVWLSPARCGAGRRACGSGCDTRSSWASTSAPAGPPSRRRRRMNGCASASSSSQRVSSRVCRAWTATHAVRRPRRSISRFSILRQEVALQRRHRVVDPAVLGRIVLPEMLVGVDHAAIGGMPCRACARFVARLDDRHRLDRVVAPSPRASRPRRRRSAAGSTSALRTPR